MKEKDDGCATRWISFWQPRNRVIFHGANQIQRLSCPRKCLFYQTSLYSIWSKSSFRRRKWHPIFCLENPMDRGAWLATIHGVAKSQTWLSMHTHTHTHSKSSLTQTFHLLEIWDRNYTKFIFIEGINEVIKEINQSTSRKWNIYLAQLQVH